jgi:lipoprotein-releasing system permease protein
MNKLIIYLAGKAIFLHKKRKLRYDYAVMILGIVISVAIVTAAITLFEGYRLSVKSILLDCNAHITICLVNRAMDIDQVNFVDRKVNNEEQIKSFIPSFTNVAIIKSGSAIRSCMVKAYPDNLKAIWYERYIIKGKLEPETNSIIIGDKLQKDLALNIGDVVSLLYPFNQGTSSLGAIPIERNFKVSAIIKTGYYEMDKSLLVMTAKEAFAFYNTTPEFTGIEVILRNKFVDKADQIAETMRKKLGSSYYLSTWIDLNGNLFSLINVEKWLIFIVFSFLILIAGLNCISIVSASVIEHKKEIAILQTIGMSSAETSKIFYLRMMSLCLLSIITGMIIGTMLAWLVTKQSFYQLKGDVYFIDRISMQASLVNYISVFIISVTLVVFCIKIPLKYVSNLCVIDILRGN